MQISLFMTDIKADRRLWCTTKVNISPTVFVTLTFHEYRLANENLSLSTPQHFKIFFLPKKCAKTIIISTKS